MPEAHQRTASIDAIIDATVAIEAGYVNDPKDRGGETIWGVTAAVARANGYSGPMPRMPREVAVQILRTKYLVRPGFDEVAALSPLIAAELFDTGVNMGPAVATQFLQVGLNALNREGRDYPDLPVDGECGPATRLALAAFLRVRGERDGEHALLVALNCLQGARYLGLTTTRPADEAFLYGWLTNRVALPAVAR